MGAVHGEESGQRMRDSADIPDRPISEHKPSRQTPHVQLNLSRDKLTEAEHEDLARKRRFNREESALDLRDEIDAIMVGSDVGDHRKGAVRVVGERVGSGDVGHGGVLSSASLARRAGEVNAKRITLWPDSDDSGPKLPLAKAAGEALDHLGVQRRQMGDYESGDGMASAVTSCDITEARESGDDAAVGVYREHSGRRRFCHQAQHALREFVDVHEEHNYARLSACVRALVVSVGAPRRARVVCPSRPRDQQR